MRAAFLWIQLLALLPALAAERTFDFGTSAPGQTPPGFRATAVGGCRPGAWKVVWQEAPPALQPFNSKAPRVSRRAVLAHSSGGPTGNGFPLLIFDLASYGNFKFASRFRIDGGRIDQTAGLVFHFQNESNFYLVRASSAVGRFQCFKVVNGQWKPPIGPAVNISTGMWHSLTVQFESTRILCALDGTNTIKLIDSLAIPPGKIGFCTGSDSAVCFADATINYPEKATLAETLVQDALEEYPRLAGLKIYASTAKGSPPVVIASKDPKEIGAPGGKTEQDVIRHGSRHFAKAKRRAYVTMPLCDRNGDPIAAVCVVLKSFPGQTGENAFARAQPVVKKMQSRVLSLQDLLH